MLLAASSPYLADTGLIIAVISAFGIPIITLAYRNGQRQQHVNDSITRFTQEMKELQSEKDEAHRDIYKVIAEDRHLMDRRLRYIEEWFMRKVPPDSWANDPRRPGEV